MLVKGSEAVVFVKIHGWEGMGVWYGDCKRGVWRSRGHIPQKVSRKLSMKDDY
jgi:hypothetical protein